MIAKEGVTTIFPPGAVPSPSYAPPPTTTTTTTTTCSAPEFHGPYTHGYSKSYPMVNGQPDTVNLNLPPSLPLPSTGDKGAHACGYFTSEFGASSFSSFESMAPTLPPNNWALWGGEAPTECKGSPWGRPCVGGNPMAQRNYPGDSFIEAFFGAPGGGEQALFNTTGPNPFKRALYLNMVAVALEKKGDIEVRRAQNHWGSITWQLNEIWPTGGWGSLEYGTVGFTPGQVIGGRWKPLHHLMADHLYKDQIAVCGADGTCYIRNDDPISPSWNGALSLTLHPLTGGPPRPLKNVPLSLPRGGGSFAYLCLGTGDWEKSSCQPFSQVLSASGCAATGTDCVLVASLLADDGITVVNENLQLLAPPSSLALPLANVTCVVASGVPPRPSDGAIQVTVSSDAFALYVFLTTLAQGRFEENFFYMSGPLTKSVWFIPFQGFLLEDLMSSLRVEHVAEYLS